MCRGRVQPCAAFPRAPFPEKRTPSAQHEKREQTPPGSKANLGSGEMLGSRKEGGGWQPITCCCPWLLHVSHVGTGYLLTALLLQVTCMDSCPCYREIKPSPRAHSKASVSLSSHPQSCSFARLFCPRTEATKQRGNPRAPSGSHRNPSPPSLRARVSGL